MTNLADKLATMPEEKRLYLLQTLPSHLAGAAQTNRLEQTLANFQFMQAKINALGTAALIADYEYLNSPPFELIRSALQLAEHIVSVSPGQLAGQLTGRLLGSTDETHRRLLHNITSDQPWLRPLTQSLDAPGRALLRTISVGAQAQVALTPDGTGLIALEGYRLNLIDWQTGQTLKQIDLPQKKEMVFNKPFTRVGADPTPAQRRLKQWKAIQRQQPWIRAVKSYLFRLTDQPGPGGLSMTQQRPFNVQPTHPMFTPDGAKLVLLFSNGTLAVYDTATWQQVTTLRYTGQAGFSKELSASAAFVAGSRQLLILSYQGVWYAGQTPDPDDHTLTLWDIDAGTQLADLTATARPEMTRLALSPDGQRLAVAYGRKQQFTIDVIDLTTQHVVNKLAGHEHEIYALSFTPDGEQLISAAMKGEIAVWGVNSEAVHRFQAHDGTIRALAIHSSGNPLAIGTSEGTIHLYDPRTNEQKATLLGHTASIKHLTFTPEGDRLLSLSQDGTVKVWQVGSQTQSAAVLGAPVMALAFIPGDTHLLAATEDGLLTLWDCATGEQTHRFFDMHLADRKDMRGKKWTTVIRTNHARNVVVTATSTGSLTVWSLPALVPLGTLSTEANRPVQDIVFLAGGQQMAVIQPNLLTLIDLEHLQQVGSITLNQGGFPMFQMTAGRMEKYGCTALAATHDEQYLVMAVESVLVVLRLPDLTEVTRLVGHTNTVVSMIGLPGTTDILTAPGGRTTQGSPETAGPTRFDTDISVWNVRSQTRNNRLTGHTQWLTQLVLAADGSRFVSSARDGTVRVWDARSRRPLATFTDEGPLYACAISSDGRRIAAGGDSRRLHILDVVDNGD